MSEHVNTTPSAKRGRGRPKGSGYKDGRPYLEPLADLALKNPGVPVAKLLRIIERDIAESVIRRVRGKWKADKITLLREARARAGEASSPSATYHRDPPMGGGAVPGGHLLPRSHWETFADQLRRMDESSTLGSLRRQYAEAQRHLDMVKDISDPLRKYRQTPEWERVLAAQEQINQASIIAAAALPRSALSIIEQHERERRLFGLGRY